MKRRQSKAQALLALIGWIALPLLIGSAGSTFGPDAWYRELVKPGWTPPDSVFAPVWTTLYVLMGVAAWRVWRHGGWAERGGTLRLFLVKLAVVGIWPVLFFGMHSLTLALIDQVVLIALIVLVMRRFARIDTLAAWLLAPYLAWVAYATTITGALVVLN